MLTKIDLEKIGELIDNRLEIALKDVVRKDDLYDFARKDDLNDFARKKDLRGFAKKKDLRLMENRMMRKINVITDYFDSNIIDLEKRTDRIENYLSLPK